MSTITWLHLSDLHFRTGQDQAWDANIVLRALLDDLQGQKEEGISPDLILVSGDIAFSGQPAEYDLARTFFDDLLAATDLGKGRLFLVPGNHDVDRGKIGFIARTMMPNLTSREALNTALSDGAARRAFMERFDGYASFANNYLSHIPFDAERYFYAHTLDLAGYRVAVMGLNSAWLAQGGDEDRHRLALGERQVRKALDDVKGADLNLTLFHHPFEWLHDADRADTEALLCSGCDFVLHGHMHQVGLLQARIPDSNAMIIAAGACYATREHPNSYNFVRLDFDSGRGTVFLRTYSDRRGGFWTKDVLNYRNIADGVYTFDLPERLAPASTTRVEAHPSDMPPLAAIRELLLSAFTDRDLRRLFFDAADQDLRMLSSRFGPTDSLADTVDKVVEYCDRHNLMTDLLLAVERANPRQYARFESLRHAEQAVPMVIKPPAFTVDPAARNAYLEVVRNQCGRVETRPYRQLSELRKAPARLSLLDEGNRSGVYVPLRFDLQRGPTSLTETDLPFEEVLTIPGDVILIGSAGCGKSTLLRLVATVLATQNTSLARSELGLKSDRLPIPVLVTLRDFEYACETAPEEYHRDVEGLLLFLDDNFERWHPGRVSRGFLSDLVRAGQTWLLLDAMDEIASFDHRIAVRQLIERLAGEYPENRFLVTARVSAYVNDSNRLDERFHMAAIRDLNRDQWEPLVRRLYAQLESDSDLAVERAQSLLSRVDSTPVMQEMVKTPLMVWTATLIHYADRDLPEQRAELYRAYVDVLLGERLHEEESAEAAQYLREERWSMEDRRLYLTYAAYEAHRRAEGEHSGVRGPTACIVIDEHDLVRRILAPFMAHYLHLDERQARREANDFVALMAERSGLLEAHEDGYSFGDHLTVQEFLAASYLVDDIRGQPEWCTFLQEHAGIAWWREVFLLTAGYLLRHPNQAQRFLLDELGSLPGDGDTHAYGLAWAGQALLELPPRRVGWHASARDELARRIVQVLWKNPPATSVAARIEAGDVLGRLGDPRFQGELSLPGFISIPAGQFWMGSSEAEVERWMQETGDESFRNECPRHLVSLGSFAVARYPTTNAMFRCFLEEEGYAEKRWWREAEADGAWQPHGVIKGPFGKERSQPAYWDDARFNGFNKPVVGITWYEAVAYCRWLTHRLAENGEIGRDEIIRLPTEAEWERAARCHDSHLPEEPDRIQTYPWGNEWKTERANTSELGLERTTPVGIFPDGASSLGILDVAGNVSEWCNDWFSEDTYRQQAGDVLCDPSGPDIGQSKIMRGGSWYADRSAVRCACRDPVNPLSADDNFGFRIVRVRCQTP